jgi:hypothetical protein
MKRPSGSSETHTYATASTALNSLLIAFIFNEIMDQRRRLTVDAVARDRNCFFFFRQYVGHKFIQNKVQLRINISESYQIQCMVVMTISWIYNVFTIFRRVFSERQITELQTVAI